MASPSWLLVALIAHVCHSSRGSKCWDSPLCGNLSNKQRILECIRMCMSVAQDERPQTPGVNEAEGPLGLGQGLTSEDRGRSDERRSYSMEHFRWGKPSGRKRRPVKVFSSSLEGEGSSEGRLPLRARRRLEAKRSGDPLGARSKSTYTSFSKQERKDGTYRMSHFRWGSPPATKRNGGFLKQWQDRPQGPLSKLFRNYMVNDIEVMDA